MTIDATFSNVPITIWSTVETTAAIFCACLPAIRAGIAILFPSLLKTTLQRSYFTESRDQTARLSKPIIMVSQQVIIKQQLSSRISGIDLEPRFVAWRVLETALGPLSPGIRQHDDEDKMSFVSLVSSVTFSPFTRAWAGARR
jgi:hypothetical protein